MGPALVIIGAITIIAVLGIPAEAGAAIGVLGIAVALWWLSLKIWPKKACWHCEGSGARSGPFNFKRVCDTCHGTGLLPRIGAE